MRCWAGCAVQASTAGWVAAWASGLRGSGLAPARAASRVGVHDLMLTDPPWIGTKTDPPPRTTSPLLPTPAPSAWTSPASADGSALVELDLGQLRPARVGLGLVRVVRVLVEVRAALGAQAGAVGPAGDLRRAGRARARRAPRPRGRARPPRRRRATAARRRRPGRETSRASTANVRSRRLQAAHARVRCSAASKRSRSAQPLPVVRETSRRTGTSAGVDLVALAAVVEAGDGRVELEPAALAGREARAAELEDVRPLGHAFQLRTRSRPSSPRVSSRLSTLPVALRGSSSMNSTSRGTL